MQRNGKTSTEPFDQGHTRALRHPSFPVSQGEERAAGRMITAKHVTMHPAETISMNSEPMNSQR